MASALAEQHFDANDAAASACVEGPWLLCRAGSQCYAVPVADVVEVLRLLPIEPVAGAPTYVRGLCIIRGSPVPVVDVGLLIGGRSTPLERLVTIRTGERTIALATQAVVGIRDVGGATLDRCPPLLGSTTTTATDAIGVVDAGLLFFLRAGRIVPDDLLDQLDLETVVS